MRNRHRWLAIAALALALPPLPAQAETGRSCVAIGDDLERLACFDQAFAAVEPVGEASAVTFQSTQLIPARPSGRQAAVWQVACEAGVLKVGFSFANQLMSATNDFAAITFQVDQQSARSRTLNASPDNLSLGFWTTAEANQFLNTLEGGSNLTVRVTPASARSLSVRFALDGVSEAIAPVRAACQ